MKRCKKIFAIACMLATAMMASAQQTVGITGLLQTPSADMKPAGQAQLGGQYLDAELLPPTFFFERPPYNTFDFYAALAPFSWIEISYVNTVFKSLNSKGEFTYSRKDRMFCVKLQPLKEGKYWPAVAVGSNDVLSSGFKLENYAQHGNGFFACFYGALTKHFDFGRGGVLGANIAYRHYTQKVNHRWDGVVGGLTYNPNFFRPLRAVVEWTGSEVNFGVDCTLWNHLMLQFMLLNGRHPSAGIAYTVNLF